MLYLAIYLGLCAILYAIALPHIRLMEQIFTHNFGLSPANAHRASHLTTVIFTLVWPLFITVYFVRYIRARFKKRDNPPEDPAT